MTSKVDYKNHDYKSFIFVLHEEYGLLLLHCTRKKKKPPHWQLPGGHVDENDFMVTGECCFLLDCFSFFTPDRFVLILMKNEIIKTNFVSQKKNMFSITSS